jgi:ATP-dependent DNA helicase PIF1
MKTIFYKATFPILLGYAITSHKAEGATISNKVVIKVRNSFAQGVTYVMLL